ncbi:hypothetical protein I9W82_000770 [Candida metapsilosis]|uniref:Uncharacterized protein n=1 Tax=Candida metapsilosis TaxID=273372 RepID=A0A8H7ZH66_9ASCO|nr:hypothetical protein I9W82_000770 [Candida metapsilosis]
MSLNFTNSTLTNSSSVSQMLTHFSGYDLNASTDQQQQPGSSHIKEGNFVANGEIILTAQQQELVSKRLTEICKETLLALMRTTHAEDQGLEAPLSKNIEEFLLSISPFEFLAPQPNFLHWILKASLSVLPFTLAFFLFLQLVAMF